MPTSICFFAAICRIVVFALFLFPIVTSLHNFQSGFGVLVIFGMMTSIVPSSVALALVLVCIAVAFDRCTRESLFHYLVL